MLFRKPICVWRCQFIGAGKASPNEYICRGKLCAFPGKSVGILAGATQSIRCSLVLVLSLCRDLNLIVCMFVRRRQRRRGVSVNEKIVQMYAGVCIYNSIRIFYAFGYSLPSAGFIWDFSSQVRY